MRNSTLGADAPEYPPMPNSTSIAALLGHSRLQEAAVGRARFVPTNQPEIIAAVLTWWNVLDATMVSSGAGHFWQTGYVREVQMRHMVEIGAAAGAGSLDGVPRYCEVGMNGGHSVVAMLLSNPRLSAHVFDPFEYPYSERVATLLTTSFGERLKISRGYSRLTLPPFVESMAANGSHCDVLLVDGDHSEAGVRFDIQQLEALATRDSRLLVDDVVPACSPNAVDEGDAADYCREVRAMGNDDRIVGPGHAVRQLAAERRIRLLERYGPFSMGSPASPCFRTRKGRHCGGRHQFDWGFVVAAFGRRRAGRRGAYSGG